MPASVLLMRTEVDLGVIVSIAELETALKDIKIRYTSKHWFDVDVLIPQYVALQFPFYVRSEISNELTILPNGSTPIMMNCRYCVQGNKGEYDTFD